MYNTRKITDSLSYVGVSDRRLTLFENIFPIEGVSYNSYILKDEKTVLFDTVDISACEQFIENIEHELNGKELDGRAINVSIAKPKEDRPRRDGNGGGYRGGDRGGNGGGSFRQRSW